MIRVESISKKFQNRLAVKDLSFEVATGEIVGLLGPNGAGKTTALRMLAGYFPPTSGRILIDNTDLWRNRLSAGRQIGYLPESAPLDPRLTTQEFLSFCFDLKQAPQATRQNEIEGAIRECGLESVRQRVIQNLSKGFRQRIGLAQALIGNPRVLIFDEPTVGLDPAQVVEVRDLIRRAAKGRTVLISSHILPEVSALCSRVLIMNHGRIVASGKPAELAAELKQSGELCLRAKGDKNRALTVIQSLKQITAIRSEQDEQNEFSLFIRYRKDVDIRPELSKRIIESDCELLELKESQVSLEEVFMKIVVEEPS